MPSTPHPSSRDSASNQPRTWGAFRRLRALGRHFFKLRPLLASLAGPLLLLILLSGSLFADDRDSSPEPEGRSLRVVFLDVGQGDSALLTTPGGKNYLIDAGDDRFSPGSKVIVPYLRSRGISKLDGIVMSHPHRDHIGGIPYLLDHVDVASVIEAKMPDDFDLARAERTSENPQESIEASALYDRIIRTLKQKKIPLIRVKTGQRLSWDRAITVTVHNDGMDANSTRVINPETGTFEEGLFNVNNMSVVLKVRLGSVSYLFTGDAERQAENAMIARGENLAATVLKAGHHGSRTSSTKKFLDRVNPTYAVIPVGKNSFRHPNQKVHEDLRKRCRRIQITGSDEGSAGWPVDPALGTIESSTGGSAVRFRTVASALLEALHRAHEIGQSLEQSQVDWKTRSRYLRGLLDLETEVTRLETALLDQNPSSTAEARQFLQDAEDLEATQRQALTPLLRRLRNRVRFQEQVEAGR